MRVDLDGHVMTWTFDRPEHGNGLDEATMGQMEDALDALEAADTATTCLSIAGDEAVFSTGLDAALLPACFADRELFAAVVLRLSRVLDRLEALPCVTVACIDGECRLGGLELALACDLIVVGDGARISDGHLAYDAMPGAGGTNRLPGRVGYGAALRFILEGPVLDARDAVRWGLADELAPPGGARDRGAELAATIARRDPSLVRAIKASLRAGRPIVGDRSYLEAFRRSVIDRLVPE